MDQPNASISWTSTTDWTLSNIRLRAGENVLTVEGVSHQGQIVHSETFTIDKDARVYIIATMNPSNYGGVNELNLDLASRFAPFPLGFPTDDQEGEILRTICPRADVNDIDNAIKVAMHSRQPKIERKLSTRDLVHFLGDITCTDTESACVILANQFRGNDMRTMADRIGATFDVDLKKRMGLQLETARG